MDHVKRNRVAQSGLAALGVLGALGVSLGLVGTTQTSAGHHPKIAPVEEGSSSVTGGRGASTPHTATSPAPSVTAPTPSPPQATTSGS